MEIMSENDVERAAERPIVSSNCQTWRRRALALAQFVLFCFVLFMTTGYDPKTLLEIV